MAAPIDPALWPRLSAAFDAALDIPAEQREAWLATFRNEARKEPHV